MRIDIEGVSHSYGPLTVLEGIDLSIASGEIVAVIGPSGCGKSTLLSIIGGLLQPTAGTVYATGAPPAGCLNAMTYVFQDFALLPWKSVRENVDFVLKGHGLSPVERDGRIDRVLAATGLSDFADAVPRQLSGGMRQRVGIARALAVSPAVLLMDEPLSALDAQTRLLLLDEFSALLSAAGATAVYVTHNLSEATRLADRVVVLSRRPGRIKAVVPIALPVAERPQRPDALATIEAELWSLIREEAAAADKELEDVG